ncbi:MAG: hypothetical protein WAQ25_02825 [Candidatus Saccharimonas sp.]
MRGIYKKNGFSAIEATIVVVVVALVGYLGYTAYTQMNKPRPTAITSQSPTAQDVAPTPAVSSTNDLDTAKKLLDDTDPINSNTADTSLLDAELNNF